MTTAALIYDMEDSETAVSSHNPRDQVCPCSLVQVLMGILLVLMAVVTGGVIWMNLSQDCPGKTWTARFTGSKTNFTSPLGQKYVIFGKVTTNRSKDSKCESTFKLQHGLEQQPGTNAEPVEITRPKTSALFFIDNVTLDRGSRLSVSLNCMGDVVDEKNSFLIVLRQTN